MDEWRATKYWSPFAMGEEKRVDREHFVYLMTMMIINSSVRQTTIGYRFYNSFIGVYTLLKIINFVCAHSARGCPWAWRPGAHTSFSVIYLKRCSTLRNWRAIPPRDAFWMPNKWCGNSYTFEFLPIRFSPFCMVAWYMIHRFRFSTIYDLFENDFATFRTSTKRGKCILILISHCICFF